MKNSEKINKSYASFSDYMAEEYAATIEKLKSNLSNLNEEEFNFLANLKNNFLAINQIYSQYNPSEEIQNTTKLIDKPLDLYVIMENWCGSSAANVPYVVKILETVPNATINFVPRDQNLEFMDLYLTNEKRSIPKIITFDTYGKEQFVWGSSSKRQEEFSIQLKEQNLEFPEFVKQMKIWFKANNESAIEADFLEIFKTL
jgi:hypothetical protein